MILSFLILGMVQINAVYSQNKVITLNVEDENIVFVLEKIEQKSNLTFVYDSNVIDTKRNVSVNVKNASVLSLLKQLFAGRNIEYTIINKQIILSRKKVKSTEKQEKVAITGVVLNSQKEAIIGATVLIKGTSIGTSTNVDGEFNLTVPSSNADLVVNYLGYAEQTLAVGNRSSFEIILKGSTISLDGVVVTALGIKRSEKALSYNVQTVDSDAMVVVKDANFINSLSGKVAGVNISTSSSGIGGGTRVVMRGNKTISGSSNALYVIDGVPMFNSSSGGGTEHGSQGTTEAIADINPEDIESMSVLTGAAAAALYGSNGANGAIIITTKQGKAGRTTLTVSSNTEILNAFITPEFQNRYGTGVIGSDVSVLNKSWGSALNSSNKMGYNPEDDYLQTGVVATESVSLSTGTDRNQTYISASALNSKGIVPNNSYDRYNFSFRNTTNFFNEKMTLDVGGSFVNQLDQNMTNQGTYSNPLTTAYLFPRGDDWNDIKMYERYDASRSLMTQYWPQGFDEIQGQNPYWINNRNLRNNTRDRFMLNANLKYEITDWLDIAGRISVDKTEGLYEEKYFASSNPTLIEGSQYGYFGQSKSAEKQAYGDVLVNINKTWNELSFMANIGASISDQRSSRSEVGGPIDNDKGIANVFELVHLDRQKMKMEEFGWHDQTQSVFASVEVGYKGTYYLNMTARNDWPSQLAGPHSVKSSFFYPSIGGSVILSEILDMPNNFKYLKLRASYASVGVAIPRFLAMPTYSWDGGLNDWGSESHYAVGDLQPERTTSYEVGLTARFLKNFNLDVSYYYTNTLNQTISPNTSITAGASKIYLQTGSVLNKGIELALGYSKSWGGFSWDSNFTFSTNKNEITEMVDNYYHSESGQLITMDEIDMGGLGQAHFVLKEGGTLGDLYSFIDLAKDSDGNIYVDENGDVSTKTVESIDDAIYLGSVFPKANLAWGNNFSIKNFNIGFMFSARLGGIVYSATQANLDYYGVSESSAQARDNGGVSVNGGSVDPYKWYSAIGGQSSGIPQYYTYSATNIRLQEASIGYTIPREKLGNIADITVSLVGRNLWMIYCKAPFDPEAVATTGGYYQGIDNFMMPTTRNIGFNVRLKF